MALTPILTGQLTVARSKYLRSDVSDPIGALTYYHLPINNVLLQFNSQA